MATLHSARMTAVAFAAIALCGACGSWSNTAAGDSDLEASAAHEAHGALPAGWREPIPPLLLGAYQPPGSVTDGPSAPWRYQLRYPALVVSADGGTIASLIPVPGPDQGWERRGLVLALSDLSGEKRTLIDAVFEPVRLALDRDGRTLWALLEGGRTLMPVDLKTHVAGAPIPLQAGPFRAIDQSPDGNWLWLTNLPVGAAGEAGYEGGGCGPGRGTDCDTLAIHLPSGVQFWRRLGGRVRDVDFVGHRALFTAALANDTSCVVVQHMNGTSRRVDRLEIIELPNCAGELRVLPGGTTALMGPRTCTADPVSVIDLKACTFLRNLPGFGPATVTHDGRYVVAFDSAGGQQRIIRIDTLGGADTVEALPVGNQAPTFSLAPGRMLALAWIPDAFTNKGPWSPAGVGPSRKVWRVDLEHMVLSKTFFDATLHAVAWLPGSEDALVTGDRWLGRVSNREITWLPTTLHADNLRVRADGKRAIIGEFGTPTFEVIDVPAWRSLGTVELFLKGRQLERREAVPEGWPVLVLDDPTPSMDEVCAASSLDPLTQRIDAVVVWRADPEGGDRRVVGVGDPYRAWEEPRSPVVTCELPATNLPIRLGGPPDGVGATLAHRRVVLPFVACKGGPVDTPEQCEATLQPISLRRGDELRFFAVGDDLEFRAFLRRLPSAGSREVPLVPGSMTGARDTSWVSGGHTYRVAMEVRDVTITELGRCLGVYEQPADQEGPPDRSWAGRCGIFGF